MRKRRHVAWSRGRPSPRQRMRARRMPPAINVRAAISVTGGMVATPILMKGYVAAHTVARASRSGSSNFRFVFDGVTIERPFNRRRDARLGPLHHEGRVSGHPNPGPLEPAFLDDDGVARLHWVVERHLLRKALAAGVARQLNRLLLRARAETTGDGDGILG